MSSTDTIKGDVIASGREWRMIDLRGADWSSETRTTAGIRITPETALQCSAFLACIRVISESVAALPLHLYERAADGGKVRADGLPLYRLLYQQPNPWLTALEFREMMTALYLMYGQSFAEIRPGASGSVSELWPLHPSRMEVEQLENGRLRYLYREPNGRQTAYRQEQIFHLRFLSLDGINGVPPTNLSRDAIGLARALEQHGSSFFGNGARPGIIMESDNPIPGEEREKLRDAWERMHRGADRAFRTAILPQGVKVRELTGSNEAAQYLETRQYQVIEVCRTFRVPPHMIQDLTRSTYSNIEVQGTEFVQHCLLPHLKRWEAAISRDLIADDERYFAEHNVGGLLRGDSAAQSAFITAMLDRGVYDIDEARAYLGMPPLPAGAGKLRLVPLNMQSVDAAIAGPPEPQPAPAIPEPADDSPEDNDEDDRAEGADAASRCAKRARPLTISIDFDQTFTANPTMWGEFAANAKASGNTVVMVSRRPDTEADRNEVTTALGDFAASFDSVLLVGEQMKADAAKAAGLSVDIWVDDSPQFIAKAEG